MYPDTNKLELEESIQVSNTFSSPTKSPRESDSSEYEPNLSFDSLSNTSELSGGFSLQGCT